MSWQQIFIPAFISFITLLIATPFVIKLARQTGNIAQPASDRWHSRPTALLGGIAIFIGIVMGGVAAFFWGTISIGIILGAVVMFGAGLYDDLIGLRPYTKIVFQVTAASILVISGLVMGKDFLPQYITVPLTFLWIIGITNAVNLLDNMDGLSTGVTAIASIFLGIYCILISEPAAIFAFVVAGATLGFLIYNFNPAKIFMGDAGSLLLGFLLASLSLIGSLEAKSHIILSMAIPVFTMALPIFDTTLVTISRKYVNRPISQGGKDHSSHRLIAMGYSERQAVLILYLITALGGGAALAIHLLDFGMTLSILIVGLIVFVGGGAFFTRVRVYTPGEYDSVLRRNGEEGTMTPIRTMLYQKRRLVEVGFDTMALLYAMYGAVWLQYQGSVPGLIADQVYAIMPLLAPGGVVLFFLFGFYKGIWRYVTVDDLKKYVSAVVVLAVMLFFSHLLTGYQALNLSTITIFSLVLFLLISGFRVSERMVASIITRRNAAGGNAKKVLLVGAGDTGNLALREIRQNDHLNMMPVGFVDDDPSKFGAVIQGCKVLGNTEKIRRLANHRKIDEIIITITDIDHRNLERILSVCRETGLPIKRVRIYFDSDLSDDIETVDERNVSVN